MTTKIKEEVKQDTCKNCKQGYTKEGYAAYPDHIELCPLHAVVPELLAACKNALSYIESLKGSIPDDVYKKWVGLSIHDEGFSGRLEAAITKAESL